MICVYFRVLCNENNVLCAVLSCLLLSSKIEIFKYERVFDVFIFAYFIRLSIRRDLYVGCCATKCPRRSTTEESLGGNIKTLEIFSDCAEWAHFNPFYTSLNHTIDCFQVILCAAVVRIGGGEAGAGVPSCNYQEPRICGYVPRQDTSIRFWYEHNVISAPNREEDDIIVPPFLYDGYKC